MFCYSSLDKAIVFVWKKCPGFIPKELRKEMICMTMLPTKLEAFMAVKVFLL